jgi:putative acetyltransferase
LLPFAWLSPNVSTRVVVRAGEHVTPAPAPYAASTMRIVADDLSGPEIRALLEEHLRSMHSLSPPESVHALDLARLRQPGISFWTAWDDDVLVGCAALKELDPKHGEIKSMRTPQMLRRRGAGRAMLTHILEVARSRKYERLSLETGSGEAFAPAQRLYESFGFTRCGPFGDYVLDPHSVFMTLRLRELPESPDGRSQPPGAGAPAVR